MADAMPRQELALYHSAWTWPDQSLEWMKSLLLFFDGLAWVLPEHHADELLTDDPVLAQPLYSAGLLRNFDPGQWLTAPLAKEIRRSAQDFKEMRFEPKLTLTSFHMISERDDEDRILRDLVKAGVITRRREDLGLDMVEMPASIQRRVLAVVAQAAKAAIRDVAIQPVGGDSPGPFGSFDLEQSAIAALCPRQRGTDDRNWTMRGCDLGMTVSSDFHAVGINLTGVPLDEVLDYRERHGAQYRAYARDVREFVVLLAAAQTDEERDALKRQRIEAIKDDASALQKARRSFARPAAGFAMSVLGATWTLKHGDPGGAILALLAAAGGLASPPTPPSTFTYLFGIEPSR